MLRRRYRFVALVVFGLGVGTFAVAESGWLDAQQVSRPLAVNPAAESPTAAQLQLQQNAIAQPRGVLRNGAVPARPLISSPVR